MLHPLIPPLALKLWQLLGFFVFYYSVVLPFPICCIVQIKQYVAFSGRLLSFSNMHFSSMSCYDLIAHCFLVLNDILLSGTAIFYLSIQTLKENLVASKFCQLWIELLQMSVYKFLCRHRFSTSLSRCQGMQSVDCMVKLCLVL